MLRNASLQINGGSQNLSVFNKARSCRHSLWNKHHPPLPLRPRVNTTLLNTMFSESDVLFNKISAKLKQVKLMVTSSRNTTQSLYGSKYSKMDQVKFLLKGSKLRYNDRCTIHEKLATQRETQFWYHIYDVLDQYCHSVSSAKLSLRTYFYIVLEETLTHIKDLLYPKSLIFKCPACDI